MHCLKCQIKYSLVLDNIEIFISVEKQLLLIVTAVSVYDVIFTKYQSVHVMKM